MLREVACTGPRRISALAAAAVALALAATLAGCGGGSGAGGHAGTAGSGGMMGGGQGPMHMGSATAPLGTTVVPGTTTSPADADGRSLFVASGCGGCHTLAAAGTTGTTGPDLDEVRPGFARVVRIVTDGSGGMPAYDGSLTAAQIRAVARFVASAAG